MASIVIISFNTRFNNWQLNTLIAGSVVCKPTKTSVLGMNDFRKNIELHFLWKIPVLWFQGLSANDIQYTTLITIQEISFFSPSDFCSNHYFSLLLHSPITVSSFLTNGTKLVRCCLLSWYHSRGLKKVTSLFWQSKEWKVRSRCSGNSRD